MTDCSLWPNAQWKQSLPNCMFMVVECLASHNPTNNSIHALEWWGDLIEFTVLSRNRSTLVVCGHGLTISIPLTQEATRLLSGIRWAPGEFIKGRRGRDQDRNHTGHNNQALRRVKSAQRDPIPQAAPDLLRIQRLPNCGQFIKIFLLLNIQAPSTTMEPLAQTVTATSAFDREAFSRKALRATPRGASSHFVGSSIVILSSFAVSTLAMNCGKRIQESRNKPNGN